MKANILLVLALAAGAASAGEWFPEPGSSVPVEHKFAIKAAPANGFMGLVAASAGQTTYPNYEPSDEVEIRKSSISGCTYAKSLKDLFTVVLDYCISPQNDNEKAYQRERKRVEAGVKKCGDKGVKDASFDQVACANRVLGL